MRWGSRNGGKCLFVMPNDVRFRGCGLKTCEFFVCSASVVDMQRVQCIVLSLTCYVYVCLCVLSRFFVTRRDSGRGVGMRLKVIAGR